MICCREKPYCVTSAIFHYSEGDCKVWEDDEDLRLKDEIKKYLVPSSEALAVETTAYVLLTAIELGDFEEAKMAACFLTSRENYAGGFKSTQVSKSQRGHLLYCLAFGMEGIRLKRRLS